MGFPCIFYIFITKITPKQPGSLESAIFVLLKGARLFFTPSRKIIFSATVRVRAGEFAKTSLADHFYSPTPRNNFFFFFSEKNGFFWIFLPNFGNSKNRTGCKIPPSLFVCATKRTRAYLSKSQKKRDGDPILLWDRLAAFLIFHAKTAKTGQSFLARAIFVLVKGARRFVTALWKIIFSAPAGVRAGWSAKFSCEVIFFLSSFSKHFFSRDRKKGPKTGQKRRIFRGKRKKPSVSPPRISRHGLSCPDFDPQHMQRTFFRRN